jgi:hypothetical protein
MKDPEQMCVKRQRSGPLGLYFTSVLKDLYIYDFRESDTNRHLDEMIVFENRYFDALS